MDTDRTVDPTSTANSPPGPMNDSPPSYSEDEPLVLAADLQVPTTYTPWWSRLLSPLQTLVGLLPAHKNTRKGREAGKRVKIIIGAVGFVTVIFGGELWLMAIGLVILALAPLLPLPVVRKRAVQNRLKAMREPRKRLTGAPAELRFEGRRLVLRRGGETLRRILTDRDQHHVRAGRVDGRLYLVVAPPSEKKSQTIWIGTEDAPGLPDGLDVEELDAERVDMPCIVDGEDWRQLARALAH